MSNSICNEVLSILESQRSFLKNIKTLSDSDLNWTPFENEFSNNNTIGIMLEHITGAESFWIHQVIGGINVNRHRDDEFKKDRTREIQVLGKNYEEMAKMSSEIILGLSDEQLMDIKSVRDTEKSVLWILLHMVEHNYYHIGQINYVLALLKNKQ